MYVDIIGRLINECPKGGDCASAVSLQKRPGFRSGGPGRGSASGDHPGSADDVEYTFGRGGRRNPRRSSFAQDGDHGRFLFDQGYNDLWFDRAVLERSHNGVLHFDLGASVRTDRSRIGDRNVAVDIDGLVGNGNKISRAHATFGRNKEAS